MSNERHRGSSELPPFGSIPDRRIAELEQFQREHGVIDQLGVRQLSDPFCTLQALRDAEVSSDRIYLGYVIHAIPGLNWYKVQITGGHGSVGASALDQGTLGALGPRTVSMYAAGTPVLVYKPLGLSQGIILGSLPVPPPTRNGGAPPDWLTQGGSSGYKRETAHNKAITGMYAGGGVRDHAAGRPIDQTQFDRGIISATGIGLNVNDAEAWLRVNEACGIHFSLFDSYARLSGYQLDTLSAVHKEAMRNDEGEARCFRGVAAYPWEALGLPASDVTFVHSVDPKKVQYTDPEAAIDLVRPDIQPIYRYQEWGGYFGQHRLMVQPAQRSQPRTYSDNSNDTGLWRESVGHDGAYSNVSAKSIYIGKRCIVQTPTELLPPEHGSGDDARQANYKFSNTFGNGPAHIVAEPALPATHPSAFQVATIADVVARLTWKALHAFRYHTKDFRVANEGAGLLSRVQESLPFRDLEFEHALPDPNPIKLRIDERYGDINYYAREAFFHLLDDGSVSLGCGWGSSIVLSRGSIRIEAPADVEVIVGRRVVLAGTQGILRFRDSVDISSAAKDVRIKAENNLQLLGGNSSEGGVLIESKSPGTDQIYSDRIGEDVRGTGIVLKSAGVVAALGTSVYLHSFSAAGVTIDAAHGSGPVSVYGSAVNVFAADGLAVWLPAAAADNEEPVFEQAHLLGNVVILDACTTVAGPLLVNDNLFVADSVGAAGNIEAGQRLADSTGGDVAVVPAGFAAAITAGTQQGITCRDNVLNAGSTIFGDTLVVWYEDDQPGNATVIVDMGFSYRDDPVQRQYRTRDFTFIEPRWQQMARLGLGTGGAAWVETAVAYQGSQLYPWPGRVKWLIDDEVFLRADLTLFDPTVSRARPLGAVYEFPVGSWTKTTMADGLKVIY